jgi:Cu(I)/Ag(I) efflux system membrane protein CusA/SilA
MVGGMVTAPLLSMLVIPAVYLLLRRRGLPRRTKDEDAATPALPASAAASP